MLCDRIGGFYAQDSYTVQNHQEGIGSTQQGNARQNASTAQERPSTGKGRNRFDDVAAAAAKGASSADLTAQLQKSLDQSKGKAKPSRNGKTDPKPKADGNGVSFAGRPTASVQTIADRAKLAGVRRRADADIDALATKLRATPDGIAAWLGNGQHHTRSAANAAKVKELEAKQPAKKAPAKVQPKPDSKNRQEPPKAVHVDVGHAWQGKVPDGMPELKDKVLVFRYTLDPSGEVSSQLLAIRNQDGEHWADGWKLPLDFRQHPEVQGNGRKVVLKGQPIDKSTLTAWLATQNLVTE